MNALATAEAASVERVGQRYFRPEAHERGLKILRQELLEDRPQRAAIALRIIAALRERDAWGIDQERIENELKAAAREARDLAASKLANVAIQAASLLAVKLGHYHDHREAPSVLQALLDFAGAG